MNYELIKLHIAIKALKLLSISTKVLGWTLAGAIYVLIFGGILAVFAIPIVLLFKLI